MLDLSAAEPSRACARCRTELAPTALACPSCAALVHADRLRELAHLADAAAADGRPADARVLWEEAQGLLPVHSTQYAAIRERLAGLAGTGPGTSASREGRSTRNAVLGGAVIVALFVASKLKFLLLGLTKISTLFSMFGFVTVYWSIYGWPLAAGLVASIYVHEMGHVAMLRRLGIRAGAPLFIPGVGALVMLKEHVTDPITDAKIGLAGPVWGLGAGVTAGMVYLLSGAPIWWAIAELTGFINLFNLIPVWQLDGARGFHALSKHERWLVLGAIGVALWATGVGMLWIVGAVAVYRTFASPPGPGHRPTLATFVALIFSLAWMAMGLNVR